MSEKIKSIFKIKYAAYLFLCSGFIAGFWYLYFGNFFVGDILSPDVDKAKNFHPFMTGLVVPLLTIGSTFLVIENLRNNHLQNFSNNFFKMMDQHHKLVENISSVVDGINPNDDPSNGHTFFDDLSEKISKDYYWFVSDTADFSYKIDQSLHRNANGKNGRELVEIIYDHYYHIHQSDLGHYFRSLYHIVKFADNVKNISEESRRAHLGILRAQLSNYELLLLAYNGLHPYGVKFQKLIEKYELIKNLNTEERLSINRVKRIVDIEILYLAYPHLKREQAELKEKLREYPHFQNRDFDLNVIMDENEPEFPPKA